MSKRKYAANQREPGGFVALPWSVLDSPAYQQLSHPAKALLLEVARQYHSDDNGRMLLGIKYLGPRGWHSPEVITRAKRELLAADLIFETVKGARPNKAGWYAVTWLSLDSHPAYDAGAKQAFVRGAYRLKGGFKNASLNTAGVQAKPPIATADVQGNAPACTADVAIRAVFTPPPCTADVHPLDMPSPGFPFWACLHRWEGEGGAAS